LGLTSLERIQSFEKLRHKVEQIRAGLQKGTGILKTARLVGTGVSALQRIKATMKQTGMIPIPRAHQGVAVS
jgi:hypothetical protein